MQKTWLNKWYSFIVMGFVFINYSCKAQTKFNVDAAAFERAILQPNTQVLDVRTQAEFNSGHIKNTMWANWNDPKEFDRRVKFINKAKPVYVYCLSGGRSASAAKKLRSQGFKQVYELTGGISAWRNAGKPLESISNENQMTLAQFEESIKGKTVLVDFGAAWCAPCKLMNPIIANIEKKLANSISIVKVDAGKDVDVCKHYNITTLPVFVVYKNGQISWQKVGVCTEAEILKAVE
jgi:thioredoxin